MGVQPKLRPLPIVERPFGPCKLPQLLFLDENKFFFLFVINTGLDMKTYKLQPCLMIIHLIFFVSDFHLVDVVSNTSQMFQSNMSHILLLLSLEMWSPPTWGRKEKKNKKKKKYDEIYIAHSAKEEMISTCYYDRLTSK